MNGPARGRPLTGRTVLIIALAAFGVVIAANLALLYTSLGSFPGLVAPNSYVASQGFDARRRAQKALGWSVGVRHVDSRLRITVEDADGTSLSGLDVTAVVGRVATQAEDVEFTLRPDAGGYSAEASLGPGLWRVEILAQGAGEDRMRARTEIRLGDGP